MTKDTAEDNIEKATDRIYATFEDAPRHPSHYEIVCAITGYHQSKLQTLRDEMEDMEDYLLNTGSFGNTIVVSKEEVLNLIDKHLNE